VSLVRQNSDIFTSNHLVRLLASWYGVLCSLSGGELFDQIADEDYKMTEAEVIRYVRQVCEGLQHMHEQNIVHLDIKVHKDFLDVFRVNSALRLQAVVCRCSCRWK